MIATETTLTLEALQQQLAELTKTVRKMKFRIRELEKTVYSVGELILTPEQEAEMERRLIEVEKDPSKGIPWEEIKAKHRRQRKAS